MKYYNQLELEAMHHGISTLTQENLKLVSDYKQAHNSISLKIPFKRIAM